MPVEDIIDFFNDRLRKRRVRFLPDEPLVFRNGQVEGRFGAFVFSSEFVSIMSTLTGTPTQQGEEALTRLHRNDGLAAAPEDLQATLRDPVSVIYADRLRRVVHMLNYIVRNNGNEFGLLFLEIDRRHIISVSSNHGRYFEAVLARCGLTPERVVFSVQEAATDPGNVFRLAQGLENYQSRGYRTAVVVQDLFEAQAGLERLWRLPPDIVKLDAAVLRAAFYGEAWMRLQYGALVHTVSALGAHVCQAGIATAAELEFVRAAGVPFMSGSALTALERKPGPTRISSGG